MFNKLSLKIVKFYIKMHSIFGIMPYEWSEAEETVVISHKSLRTFTFYLAEFQVLGYFCFLIFRLLQLGHETVPSYPDVIWQYIWINLYIWAITSFWNAHVKKNEVVRFLRGLKKLGTELSTGIKIGFKMDFEYFTIK
jgi:hypothetical protein